LDKCFILLAAGTIPLIVLEVFKILSGLLKKKKL